MKSYTVVKPPLSLGVICFFCSTFAQGQDLNANVTKYETTLSANRIIYDSASNGSSISVSNPQDYPVLIQATVLSEDRSVTEDYIVTPPIFRLDANKNNKISIFYSGKENSGNNETLNWLCVKSIPPKSDDDWARGLHDIPQKSSANIQLALNNCIKLIGRPHGLSENPEYWGAKIKWMQLGKRLKAENSSHYFMNLSNVYVDGKELKNIGYIKPQSSREFFLPAVVGGSHKVTWKIINDFGGESNAYSQVLH